jgi:hypothetical protein
MDDLDGAGMKRPPAVGAQHNHPDAESQQICAVQWRLTGLADG